LHNSILSLIGNTPVIKTYQNYNYLYFKLEFKNPFGSIKDRAAYKIICDSIACGKLKNHCNIIEATSGNMGISLSAISKIYGNTCTVVMPENMSESRKNLIRSYGADLILTPQEKGIQGSIDLAQELSIKNGFYWTDQFNNQSSVLAHFESTAPEIYKQTNHSCDYVLAGIGSGGTISGIGQYFKKISPRTQIIGVLPESYPHKIQGIGAGFTPSILNLSLIDKVIRVSDEESEIGKNELLNIYGIFAGFSSGAVFSAYKKLTSDQALKNKHIVLILADSGERYI
jgi:cysteine synthase A